MPAIPPAAPVTPTANMAPAQPPAPQVPVSPVSDPTQGESKRMIIWFVIGLVVVIALVGGIYFFLRKQQASQTALNNQPIVQTPPKPEDTVDALDKDLTAVDINSSDTDFASVDQDIQQL